MGMQSPGFMRGYGVEGVGVCPHTQNPEKLYWQSNPLAVTNPAENFTQILPYGLPIRAMVYPCTQMRGGVQDA
jgi:hypothetical protein